MNITPNEMAEARRWLAAHLETADTAALPFSFTYGGQPSAALLKTWTRRWTSRKLDDQRQEHTLTYTDPKTHLAVRCVIVEYHDFPTLEWTLYFQNTGTANTPILEKIQALDTRLERGAEGEFVLHHNKGDDNTPDSYQPLAHTLSRNTNQAFAPRGGRPSEVAFPYFNLQKPGGGLILAVGWPGRWATTFQRDAARGLQICAGQELTHLTLQPGEEVRTPLIVLFFWEGADIVRAQNLWRRWLLAHNLPRPGGQPPSPLLSFCSGGFFPGLKVSEASEKEFIDTLTREGIKLDYWWMDAGWYPCEAWPQTGTWEPDAERFPHGLKAVSDYAHAHGSGLIVWFEPERATPGTWLHRNHPEWLLGPRPAGWPEGAKNYLFNLGNPEARQWMVERVDQLLSEEGIDLYRQDFNMDPLPYWRANDAEDRQGITENHHVTGYLAYWDELRRRHPGMLIDSCAGGGRRNDLETLRRAVPLLRSDYQSFQGDLSFAPGNQGHTYGLSSWIPYYGHGVYYNPQETVYAVRSYMCAAFGIAVDVRKEGIDWNLYRRMVAQWQHVAPCFLGDYYPLTSYSLEKDVWMAWQFDRPDLGEGLVQVFRRAESPYETAHLRLHGLDPKAYYTVTDLDTGEPRQMPGRVLMEQGLPVSIAQRPAALLLTYRRAN